MSFPSTSSRRPSSLFSPRHIVGISLLGLILFFLAASAVVSARVPESSVAPAAIQVPGATECFVTHDDTYVDSAVPDENYGPSNQLLVDANSGGDQTLIFAAFDIGGIPQTADIISATLGMELQYLEVGQSLPTTLQAADGPWDEGTLTWNTHPGAAGSYDAQNHDGTPGIKRWNATKLVQEWHGGNVPNNGLVVRPDLPPGAARLLAAFASKESRQTTPPTLCVTWSVPPDRPPLPPWTPIPPQPPSGPTPTPTPALYAIPYSPTIVEPIFTLPDPDLSIHGIELTQGIQCFDTSNGLGGCGDNSLPVVTKKNSTARIYLKYSGLFSSMSNVPVRLRIRANGVWYTANTHGRATTGIDQGANDDARVYFNVNFTNDVTVDFYAVVDPNDTIDETNESNNRYPSSGYITLNFRRRDPLKIVGQRLRYHPSGYGGDQYAGGWAVNGGGADWFEQLLPIRNNGINYQVKSGYLDWTTSLGSGSGQHDLIEYLNTQWILRNAFVAWFGANAFTGADHVYGWAPNDGYSGGHADMPVYPHAGGLGVVGIGTDRPGTSTDNPGGGAYILGHELVHDYDIFHTNTGADDCGSNDGNSDFPYSTSSIQEYGFNPITGKIYDPADTHDLMSYCPAGGSKQGWVSPFTWNRMFNNLALTASNTAYQPQSETADYTFRPTAAEQSLVVNATIYNPDHPDYAGTPGQLGDLHRIAGNVAYGLPDGNYAVELRDGGTVLYREDFVVSFESEYDAHGSAPFDDPPFPPDLTLKADLSFIVPWVAGTDQIVLLQGTTILDQRDVSPSAPQVTITDPTTAVVWDAGATETLSWTGTDGDGDELSYTVLYSSDGGADWSILTTGYPSTTLTVEVDSLAGTNDGRFRVVATDGINTGYDETDEPIEIANKPPLVTIMEPQENQAFLPGALVVLSGSATDLEDGNLDDADLEWSSDRQGSLGIGPAVPLNTLQPGTHVITLTARDSYGVTTSESVTIFIGHRSYLPAVLKP